MYSATKFHEAFVLSQKDIICAAHDFFLQVRGPASSQGNELIKGVVGGEMRENTVELVYNVAPSRACEPRSC